MRNFATETEAKEHAKDFGKHQFEHVTIGEKSAILCGTDQAYEEELWGDAYQMVEDFCTKFSVQPTSEDEHSDFATAVATQIRDLILKEYEDEYKTKFVDVYDEY